MQRRRFAFALGLASALLATAPPSQGRAYTTRVHIALSNEIRAALIASGDGTIQLRWSDHAVIIPLADADAIVNQPLAFRAGAIGPDNVVFPAMTDGSHGVEQDPYRQCEILYAEALTEVERAYALGCFLHGATDAIAHHFVNYFTGETFTLNPISASRASSWDNVVGHIVAESVIQGALHAADPALFSAGQLQHALPHDFILRTYYDVDSPVWQRLAMHAVSRWDATRAADPGGNLLTWAQDADFAPWEQIAMAPVYIDELQRSRADLRAWIVLDIAEMADSSTSRGNQLRIQPGPDGVRGTPDDTRGSGSCSVTTFSCAELVARYYVLVNVLAPRYDAGGRPLPSAFDVLSDGIGDQLYGFLPALVRVIDNLSATLNAPIAAGDTSDHGFDVSPATISTVFLPLTDWVDTLVLTTESGFDGLADSVTPAWYRDLSNFLRSLGVDISIGNVLRLIYGPIVDEIRDALISEVRDRAETYVRDLTAVYRADLAAVRSGVYARLDGSAPTGLGGHALDYALDSGLFAYSFNITAATLANHEVVLVGADPIENGPASFDASYTPEWMQLGACSYLRDAVFPRGLGLVPLLSVQQGPSFFVSSLGEDSPIECHDGSLSSFGDPSLTTCAHTTLDGLYSDPTGSVSRAFPPAYAAGDPACRRLTVPGLPGPPPLVDAGTPPVIDAGPGADGGNVGFDGGPGSAAGGCGCSAPGRSPGAPWALVLAILAGAFALRGRRGAPRASSSCAALLVLVLVHGCDGPVGPVDAYVPPQDAGADSSIVEEDSATPDEDGGTDAGSREDAGPDLRRLLLDSLDDTVWSGMISRDEGGVSVSRAYEMSFDSRDLRWAEIRNPFGPARMRVLRSFNVQRDGRTVESTVQIPTGWETPEPMRGRRDTWDLEIVEGSPRYLVISNSSTGAFEEYSEGAWPEPTDGLTAEVRVFGSTGPVFDAYCGASSTGWERGPIWDFARGRSSTLALRRDVVAGAHIREWADGMGSFGATDIDGFDRLGGTLVTDQSNFVVRFHGAISHSGHLSIREQNDDVENMAAWVFTGANVGVGGVGSDLFEIFHLWGDDDEIVTQPGLFGSGTLPVEVIVVWCAASLGREPFTLEANLVSASPPWRIFGDVPSTPIVNAALFPPAL